MTTVTNRFEDSRGWCCAAFNEVSIDYNAAFTGALARLAAFYDGMKSFSDCTLDLGWTHPNATLVRHQAKSNAGVCLPCRPQSRSGRRTTATTAAAMARKPPPRQQWSAAARR